jgi:hypothetical protein
MIRQQFGENASMMRVKVLHQHETHTCVGWQALEKFAEGFQAAGGSSDSNNGEGLRRGLMLIHHGSFLYPSGFVATVGNLRLYIGRLAKIHSSNRAPSSSYLHPLPPVVFTRHVSRITRDSGQAPANTRAPVPLLRPEPAGVARRALPKRS